MHRSLFAGQPGVLTAIERPYDEALQSLEQEAGLPLPHHLLEFAGSLFDFDFSTVTDHQSPLPDHLGAAAVAYGRRLAFSKTSFDPTDPSNIALLAHELTHVLQQRPASSRLPGRRTTRGTWSGKPSRWNSSLSLHGLATELTLRSRLTPARSSAVFPRQPRHFPRPWCSASQLAPRPTQGKETRDRGGRPPDPTRQDRERPDRDCASWGGDVRFAL